MSGQILDKNTIDILSRECIRARESSYSPYSKFRVGCSILLTNGKIIRGCNVEVASFAGTICAERTAIVKLISDDEDNNGNSTKLQQVECIGIIGDTKEGVITPCGICRQVLREFLPSKTKIVMFNNDGTQNEILTLEDLLPYSFGSDSLGT
ncbi:hypothetical protein Kpol_541p32 [Vanderwaltozyma polyspora DSM 70294]|uniref:Cytidine deaminase n=1 Tax=Vanderwaltozyma polyspora (strain ATCC 22028 / DSM 70294 / BCRC 21397 / CBS 2163 / NBRC 10782 / NRRL Y-8283 / UCD 57-17) TaxID=436907 RepID=A7TIX7_VANPO|nr:uncharacterized protein Kpol_541p32 [Vanderwaltozyma polyspora DSM 70294]EDO17789.1 hypothetical protein Kpol_541p32 [Vanderwaltozyma polyspora DSM 70294]